MSHLIPLAELPIVRDGPIDALPEPRVVWGVDLPASLDQERILFDADHLRRIQKMSGSALTLVATDADAKAAEYDASIQGINLNGTATMGRVKKISAEDPSKKRTIYEFDSPSVNTKYGTFVEAHLLNKAAMVDSVVDLRSRKAMSSEEAWGQTLDDHIQRSIRQTGQEVLLNSNGHRHFSRNFEYGWLAFVGMNFMSDVVREDALGAGLMAGVFALNYGATLFRDTRINKMVTGEALLDKKRWSLFTESQIDRYIALSALTRVNSIIKVRK